ncbi:uncharacterized protein BDZ99DRAFT_268055 [Mytilinidion resinicola]|uniref:Uncharacterized protein n=1 Tax=Mytilinidion resinicola TaxID=574789 RepID=A0A6A6YVF0_9PEZI|nr:uncharacterized protein BDZ99DRAFT_268055 [Mytilinidion resinicola]KAF2812499.1 hypothetical protein BDZ99DRAFT_268055 [Mytilinidion resinicola]
MEVSSLFVSTLDSLRITGVWRYILDDTLEAVFFSIIIIHLQSILDIKISLRPSQNSFSTNMGRGAYDTTGTPKPPPRTSTPTVTLPRPDPSGCPGREWSILNTSCTATPQGQTGDCALTNPPTCAAPLRGILSASESEQAAARARASRKFCASGEVSGWCLVLVAGGVLIWES